MARKTDEDIPYRSAIPEAPDNSQVTSKDEDQYSTLLNVQKTLAASVEALSKDFNAFDLYTDKPLSTRGTLILHEIEVRQGVFDIVAPLLDSVNDAIKIVDSRHK